jgi:hypothetical protein
MDSVDQDLISKFEITNTFIAEGRQKCKGNEAKQTQNKSKQKTKHKRKVNK